MPGGSIHEKKTLVENLETNIEQMESSGKILIKEYRQENRKYRKTDPPNYFKEDIDPPPHAKVEVNIEGDIAVISEQKNLMDQFVVRVEQIKNNITDSYTQSINTIANIQLEAND